MLSFPFLQVAIEQHGTHANPKMVAFSLKVVEIRFIGDIMNL